MPNSLVAVSSLRLNTNHLKHLKISEIEPPHAILSAK